MDTEQATFSTSLVSIPDGGREACRAMKPFPPQDQRQRCDTFERAMAAYDPAFERQLADGIIRTIAERRWSTASW